jgi:phage-related minor tail protein
MTGETNEGAGALGGALAEMRGMAAGFAGEIVEASKAIRNMDGEARRLSRSLSSSLRSAFDKAVFGGEKLTDVFRDLASSVAGRALDAALKPVSTALAGGFSGLFGGLTGAVGSAFGFADGAAFSAGRVRAFARGGVVSGPTLFPMRGGTGLMGEAGPEAILPLSRGPDGRLGIAARGGAGTRPVVVNIQTPDVAGFRASRGQVSAQLARAVRRGQGRL